MHPSINPSIHQSSEQRFNPSDAALRWAVLKAVGTPKQQKRERESTCLVTAKIEQLSIGQLKPPEFEVTENKVQNPITHTKKR